MSYDTERYSMEKLSNQSLAVIECGLQICHSGHSSGRLVYRDYSAHFILEGRGTYSVGGCTYELGPGDGFMITPDIPNIYIADEAEPWKYIYASFKGHDAKTLVHHAGLNDDNVIFTFPMEDEVIGNIKKMHSSGKDRLAKGYDTLGYFLLVMSRLVAKNASVAKDAPAEHYISMATSFIEDRFSYDISVGDIADYVGIDRSYLYRLFKTYLGTTPSEMLMDARMRRAVSLLEYEELTVNEIALSSGFYDLSHFSRAFASRYRMSPGKYRKNMNEK